MISLNTVLAIVCFMLTIILYILLGINDFKPQKKQLFALIPLLLLLLTLYRMDNMLIVHDSVKNENNTYETPTQQEEVIKLEVPVTVTQSKSIEVAERQLQTKNQKLITNIPIVQNEIKKEVKVNDFISHINQASESLPFVVVTSLILSGLSPQAVYQ